MQKQRETGLEIPDTGLSPFSPLQTLANGRDRALFLTIMPDDEQSASVRSGGRSESPQTRRPLACQVRPGSLTISHPHTVQRLTKRPRSQ